MSESASNYYQAGKIKVLRNFPELTEKLQSKTVEDFKRFAAQPTRAEIDNREFKKFLVIGCVHRPFHNQKLWDAVLRCTEDAKVNGVKILGDYLDLYSLGSYNAESFGLLKDMPTLSQEYEDGNKGLDELESVLLPDAENEYVFGNHEDRFFREFKKKDNAKYGAALQSPTVALRLHERGYKVHENWQDDVVQFSEHLEGAHGVFCNIHAAQKHVLEFDTSVIFFHTHRFQIYGAGRHIGYNLGGLFDKDNRVFSYMYKKARVNKWMNGLGFANIAPDGRFWIEPIQAFDSSFFYNGKFY